MTQAGRRWSPEEDDLVMAGYRAGVSYDELAAQLGRDVLALRNRTHVLRRRAGEPPRRRLWTPQEDAELASAYSGGLAVKEIATRLDRTQDAVAARLRGLRLAGQAPRRTKPWSPDDLELLALRLDEGASASAIAAELERTPAAVYNQTHLRRGRGHLGRA